MDAQALITEIARQTGENDTGYRATILRYMNKYYKQLEYLLKLPELISDTIIAVPKYYNTGTVTVTNGSATVTGASTVFTSSHVGWFFQIDGIPDVFRITARASDTSITINSTWIQGTESAKTYRIWKSIYALPADFNKLISITQGETPMKVEERSIEQMDRIAPTFYRTTNGTPANVVIYKNAADYDNETTTQLSQMVVWPAPDDDYQITVKYLRHLSKLTDANTSYPVFDDARLDEYLIDRTCSRVYLEKEDNRAALSKEEAQEALLILKQFFEDKTGNDDRFMLQYYNSNGMSMIDRTYLQECKK